MSQAQSELLHSLMENIDPEVKVIRLRRQDLDSNVQENAI
jgi:hypothetical protein